MDLFGGRYRVQRELGRGGMGAVYEVLDERLDRRAALKVLGEGFLTDAMAHRRFEQEARAASRLNHPNIATVFDYGREGSVPYLVMELVEGPALSEVIAKEGPLDPTRVIAILAALADALATAHGRGIIHRDFKPSNVVMCEMGPKLLDFGLARVRGEDMRATAAGTVAGTPLYLAPERLRGIEDDPRSDLYALGVSAFEMLTGQPLFDATTPAALLVSHLTETPRSLGELREVPPGLEQLVRDLLAKSPDERPPSARVVAARFESLGDPERPAAHAETALKLPRPRAAERSNLGADAPLVGREALLDELSDRFDGSQRLVTLLGPGGIGKTSLSRALARRFLDAERFDEVWFVDLSNCRATIYAVTAVANALGVSLADVDPDGIVDKVGYALAQRGRVLLVMDNFEHVVAASAALSQWLTEAHGLCSIVTTREVLAVPDELVVEVEPLSPESALELFLLRAEQRGRTIDEDERVAAKQLVERLDRIPLAVELAAGRTPVLRCDAILERIEKRFQLLRSGRGKHSRQSSLRAALDWSWDLLDEVERSALAQCGIFEGPFDIARAEEVLAIDDDVLDVIQSLRSKSLIYTRGARLALYETVRAYACEKLDEMNLTAPTRDRHARVFLRRGKAHAASAKTIDAARAIEALAVDRDDINAARVAMRDIDPGRSVELALAMSALLAVRGPASAHLAILDAASALAETHGEMELLVRVRIELGELGVHTGRRSAEAARETSELARRHAPQHLAYALAPQVFVELHGGAETREIVAEALAAAEHALVPAHARAVVAVADLTDRFVRDLATEDIAEQLATVRAAERPATEVMITNNAALFHAICDRVDEAAELIHRALRLARVIDHGSLEAMVIGNLGFIRVQAGELDAGISALRQAIELHHAYGNDFLARCDQTHLAAALYGEARYAEARELFEQVHADTLASEGTPQTMSMVAIGSLYADLGDLEAARHVFATAAARRSPGRLGEVARRSYEVFTANSELLEARLLHATDPDGARARVDAVEQRVRTQLASGVAYGKLAERVVLRAITAFPRSPVDV